MDSSPTKENESEIAEIIGDGEKPVAVLGSEFLGTGGSLENSKKTVLILTDTKLHQAGVYFAPNHKGTFKERTGANSFELADLTAMDTYEKIVPAWYGITGWSLLIGGLALLAGSFIHGGGFLIAISFFVGPIWMSVPGALMISYQKTGGDTLLRFTSDDRVLAVSGKQYDEQDLEAFKAKCMEVLDLPAA